MSVRVDPGFLKELERFGAFDIQACFHCGNCSAVCSLSQGKESFPRRLVRFAQLGMRDRLAASREVWLCYYCGECSKTCPRQAEPGEFVAAARRYFIARWDLTSLARRLYTSPLFTAFFMGVLAVLFTGMLLYGGGKVNPNRLDLFGFIDLHWLHYTGIAVLALAGLAAAANIGNLVRNLKAALPVGPTGQGSFLGDAWAAVRDTVRELAAQKNFEDCQAQDGTRAEPWYLGQRTIHLAIMWGFLGLWAATALDFLFKTPGSYVPLWYPARLLGTAAGIVLLYGTTVAMVRRLTPARGSAFAHSLLSDWLLLGLLWVVALTGFILEIAVYQPRGSTWAYAAALVHVVLALELLILMPFTKFAHALYRPIALGIFHWQARRESHVRENETLLKG
jgi:nitrate reductase gamma subunit/ferredoxin